MPPSTAMDTVQELPSPLMPESIDDVKSEMKQNEKAECTEVVIEIEDPPRRKTAREYVTSIPEAFSKQKMHHYMMVMVRFAKFMGPGTIISVAYIDPDNYQTAVSAGAEFGYKLLFMVLVSNLIAIYLQVGARRSILVKIY